MLTNLEITKTQCIKKEWFFCKPTLVIRMHKLRDKVSKSEVCFWPRQTTYKYLRRWRVNKNWRSLFDSCWQILWANTNKLAYADILGTVRYVWAINLRFCKLKELLSVCVAKNMQLEEKKLIFNSLFLFIYVSF